MVEMGDIDAAREARQLTLRPCHILIMEKMMNVIETRHQSKMSLNDYDRIGKPIIVPPEGHDGREDFAGIV